MLKKITSHTENYLEAIFLLEKEHGHAHVKDIAKKLRIKMPSATQALGKLRQKRLINYRKYGFVTLTRKGSRLAQNVYKRHRVLYDFLCRVLGVDETVAEADACRIEHAISAETFKKINKCVVSRKFSLGISSAGSRGLQRHEN